MNTTMDVRKFISSGNIVEISGEKYVAIKYRDDIDSLMLVGELKCYFTTDFNENGTLGRGNNKILINCVYELHEQLCLKSAVFTDPLYDFSNWGIIWRRDDEEAVRSEIAQLKKKIDYTQRILDDYNSKIKSLNFKLQHMEE